MLAEMGKTLEEARFGARDWLQRDWELSSKQVNIEMFIENPYSKVKSGV